MIFDNENQVGWRNRLITLSLLLVFAGSAFTFLPKTAAAPPQDPPGPDRFSVTVVDYTKYFWWLIHWGESDVECEITTDHEGLPTPGDIFVDCGENLYDKWIKQSPAMKLMWHCVRGFIFFWQIASPPKKKSLQNCLLRSCKSLWKIVIRSTLRPQAFANLNLFWF